MFKSIIIVYIVTFFLIGCVKSEVALISAECEEAFDAENFELAFTHCKIDAEKGNAVAQRRIGFLFSKGLGTPQSYSEAIKWSTLSATQGDVKAQFNLAVIYYSGPDDMRDYKKAFKWAGLAAEQNWAPASNLIALMYYGGEGTKQSYKDAAKWFESAANQGHSDAQFRIASMYSTGEGVAQDYYTASKYYQLAAEQGDLSAQFFLGWMYLSGLGVRQNFTIGYMWTELASIGGDKAAKEKLNSLAGKMKPDHVALSQSFSKECLEKEFKNCYDTELPIYLTYPLITEPSTSVDTARSQAFSNPEICKAGVSQVMGRNPSIVKIDSVLGNITHLSYFSPNDGSQWKFKCRVDGNQVLWGNLDGRWRTHSKDSRVTFAIHSGTLTVREIYSDGSVATKSFSKAQLMN